ncbi:transporter [Cereibacter sp. SYSU M97828]|nr:transporter [Cereibacter flavus]
MHYTKGIAILAAAALLAADQADATEAAAGRYIPGVFALPKGGAIPPPGLYWNITTAYYNGSIGANVSVPVGGEIRAGLEATIAGPTLTALWVPNGQIGDGLSFALGVSVPFQYLSAEASVGMMSTEQSQTALGDIAIAPKIGWKSGTHFFSAGVNIFMPTGSYHVGSLDNTGMNYWTVSPNVSYTYLDVARGLDFSVNAGVDINTENTDTDYQSGTLAHLDAIVIKKINDRFSAGVFGSVLYQLEDDEGGLADQLDGFKGRSYAIGPVVTYEAGPKERPINIAFSWAPEFGTKNRPKGNAVYLSISGTF